MPKKTVLLIDGGHLRAMARIYKIAFSSDFVSDFCAGLPSRDEDVQKILYYDCRPYSGTQMLPISRQERVFSQSDEWLEELSVKDLFAVRLGQLKFRGWAPKRNIQQILQTGPLTDRAFVPNFEQKGVDMRIGIDIANISNGRSYDRILLVSSDTDMVPAMKEARKAGIQVAIYQLPFIDSRAHRDKLKADLRSHADFVRDATWPAHHVPAPQD